MKALAGLALAAAHFVAFVAAVGTCDGGELAVDVQGPNAAPALSLRGTVPDAIADRVTESVDTATGPGLVRKRWTVRYRGGFERSVGAAQLVGPFQDPAARACVGRVVVGQKLLDDGTGGPSTLAGQLARVVAQELAGEGVFPAGDFVRVSGVGVQWARLEWHPWDLGFVGEAPHGYVRARLTIEMQRVSVPVVLALVPSVATTELGFRVAARAELAFDNRVAQWLSDRLGGDRFATKIARGHVDGVLVSALAPPPPLELPGGHVLRFGFCAEPPSIIDGHSGALPFTVELGHVDPPLHSLRECGAPVVRRACDRDPSVLPVRRGPGPRPPLGDGAALAIDLDLDALDAILYELWRGGFLDRELAAAGLDRIFNADPLVTELLSLRISPVVLALPPVLSVAGTGLRLSAEARVMIADGGQSTVGRVWGGLDFAFAGALGEVGVDLGALELSCERTATTLVPCYADLVAAMRDRAPELHGTLTTTFAAILADLFVERRLADPQLPAELVIRAAVPRLVTAGTNATVHLDLDAALHSTREPR